MIRGFPHFREKKKPNVYITNETRRIGYSKLKTGNSKVGNYMIYAEQNFSSCDRQNFC